MKRLFTNPLEGFRRVDGKSLSFFAPDERTTRCVDGAMIDALLAASMEEGQKNARVCLHSSPESTFHEMIVLEWRGSYFPPHRHRTKGESLHIIKGELRVMAFNEAGKVSFHKVIGKDGARIVHIAANQWHFTSPLSKYVVYAETKLGPFLGDSDREFAPWADEREEELRGVVRV